jgi:hypothetical protein
MPTLVTRLVRQSRVPALLILVASLVVAGATWRPKAQGGAGNQAVRPEQADRRQAPASGDRGSTYEWLENRATRVTTRFVNAMAVSERLPDGDVETRLTSLAGTDLGMFTLDRLDVQTHMMHFRSSDGKEIHQAGRAGLHPTLDWANRQAYSLWKDRGTDPADLAWQEDLMRAWDAREPEPGREATEIRTEWADGFSAVASREIGSGRGSAADRGARGNSFVSRLRHNNADVGFSRWHPDQQVLEWSFPGLTEGYLTPQRLDRIGGWPFVPDMAWANVQSFAFHHFHTLVATRGFVARQQDSWKSRLLNLAMPRLLANEPGCDGLHWLDRSVFRPCCDSHDRCYEKNGCGSSSWWQWWQSWTCNSCNTFAVFCFVSGGGSPYHQSPY